MTNDNLSTSLQTSRSSEYLRPADIAKLCGVHKRTVANWRQDHADFPRPRKLGRVHLYARAAVIAWIEKQAESEAA